MKPDPPPATPRTRSLRRRIAWALAILLVVFFGVLGVHRSTAVLDRPLDTLVMPPLAADVWYQGQGLPIRMALLREGSHDTPAGRVTILPGVLESLPYKNNEETAEWVDEVNRRYRPVPAWRHRPERRLGHYKCMSLSASTVRDWLRLREGRAMESYTSMLNGRPESGLDPKVLDSLYFAAAKDDPERFDLTGEDHYDPVSNIPVPCGMRGFVKLLVEPPAGVPARDVNLPGVEYPWTPEDLLPDFEAVEVIRDVVFNSPVHDVTRDTAYKVRDAIREYGALFAGIRVRFSGSGGVMNYTRAGDLPIPFLTGHAVVIVGWIEQAGDLYFVYRETFGKHDETTSLGGPAYRVYPVFGFSEVYGFRKRKG